MAQQATSTRELQIGSAANRQAPQLNQQSSPDYQASNRQMAFADKLTNFGGSLGKAMRKDELDAEEIRKANEVKFKDADLLGFPFRIVVSTRNLKNGQVEITNRQSKDTTLQPIENIIPIIEQLIAD